MLKKRYFAATVLAMVGLLGLSAPPASYADGYGSVSVNKSNGNITIGNDAISRTFGIADGKLTTVEINNKLASTKLVPGSGSEEFVIQSLAEATRLEPTAAPTSVRPTAATAVGSSVDSSEGAPGVKGDRWRCKYLLGFFCRDCGHGKPCCRFWWNQNHRKR